MSQQKRNQLPPYNLYSQFNLTSSRENLTLLHANNKDGGQPVQSDQRLCYLFSGENGS